MIHWHEPTTIDILLNVVAQIVNLLIFFFLFKWLLADKIVAVVEKRKESIDKIKRADEEYEKIVAQSKQEAEKIEKEALEYKNNTISAAKQEADSKKEKILEEANRKAESIIENANQEIRQKQKDMEEEWEYNIREVSKMVVKKLFEEDSWLKDKYLDKVVKEFK